MSTHAVTGRERDSTRVTRSIAELRRVAADTYAQDKATDLLSRLAAGSTYVDEDETSRWNAQVAPTSDLSPWPAALRSLAGAPDAKFGLFHALRHAYLIHGTTLYLWDYSRASDNIVTCPATPDPILAVGVTAPLPGTLFSDVVRHLLVLVTEKEVRLLAMVADKSTGGWKVQDTLMQTPVPPTTMLSSVICSLSRRIFLGGVDGALYEYVYHPHLPKPPATEKVRSVRLATSHWNQYLPPVVRDLLAPAQSAIVQLLHDDRRQVVWARHSTGHVSVYDARAKDVVSIAYAIVDPELVALSLVTDDDASVQAVATTAHGVRLFLAATTDSCRVVFSHPPPPAVVAVDCAAYASGVAFFGHGTQLVSAAADVGLAATHRERVQTHAVLGAKMVVEETSLVPSAPVPVSSLKRSATGGPAPAPALDFLRTSSHELSTQFAASTPRAFVCLSAGGVQFWSKQRPLDHLRALLTNASAPLSPTSPLVASYGPAAVACMLFALACDPAPPRPPAHLLSLIFDIGGHPRGDEHSAHYTGLVRVVVRFLSPIWRAALAQAAPKPATAYVPVLAKAQLERPRDQLCRLRQLLEHVAVPYAVAIHATTAPTDGGMLATEQRALQDVHTWIGRCIAACEALLLVHAHPTAWTHVASLAFYDVVGTDAGAAALQAMLLAAAKETPAVVPTALARCGAFFSLADAGPFQGTDALSRAKAAATPAARDAALNEALAAFVAAAPTWPAGPDAVDHLRRLAKDFELCAFWRGLVELTVAVAARFSAHSAAQRQCYDGLVDALVRLAEHGDAELSAARAVVSLVVASPDVHLQEVVLAAVVAGGHKAWLVGCPVTPTVKAVLAADTDWLAALCLEHGEYEEAATVLWTAAHDLSVRRPIGDRAQWVARALSSIQHTTNATHAQDIQDALDVFQAQTRLAAAFRAHNLGTPEVQGALEFDILDMSTLYHQYALPYERYEDCLRIMHACKFYEPHTIVELWKRALYSLLPQVADCDAPAGAAVAAWLDAKYADARLGAITAMSSAFEAGEWQRSVGHLVVSLGRALHPSPVFPVEWLVAELEAIAHRARSVGGAPVWMPVHLFVDLGLPAADVLAWYLHMLAATDTTPEKLQYLRGIVALAPSVTSPPSQLATAIARAQAWLASAAPGTRSRP
ncbi:nuclear pore complex protein [Achlya hypogyna]|uniref:Nuclear pore complex protein n=1 Tax=Achlya hypogyna TaxID=1202772 RepID=A0A1V9Z4D2_ACHHY|nr:nuclear pore complex protein [Achlya hypogyna]